MQLEHLSHNGSPVYWTNIASSISPGPRRSDVNDFDTGLYITCTEGDTLPGGSSRVTTNHFPLTPFAATVRSATPHPPSLTLTHVVPATLTTVAEAH